MIPERFSDVGYKFRTAHRDDYYKQLGEDPLTSLFFATKIDTLLAAFAIGYRIDKRQKPSQDGPAINHTNLSYVSTENRELIITLMLKRFPNLSDAHELWSIVEEYAEYGICVLYKTIMIDHEGDLNFEDLIGKA